VDVGKRILSLGTGLLFSILWASASAATKIGLRAAQPFVICVVRFFLAGLIMLLIAHVFLRKRLPQGKQWGQIALYGLLTNSIYLGLFVLAIQQVSPGLGTLAVATNPVFINLLSALFLGQRLRSSTIFSLLLCGAGVVLAAWPLLRNSTATPAGLLILLAGMLAYSVGVFYFSRIEWQGLHLLTINGWQVLFGGIFLLPLAVLTYTPALNTWNMTSVGSILWLAIPVSIGAVQLWLYLLKEDATRASFWLFLCPVFGFLIANVVTHEPITGYTIGGMALVIGGIYWQNAKGRY
jgi:drug/metabolite transporter (DMT)-like permease